MPNGKNPYGNLCPGHSLNHIEHSTVTAANEDGVEAFLDALPGLLSGRLRGKRLNHLNRTPPGAKQHRNASDGVAMDPPLLKDRIDKQKDTTHPGLGYRRGAK